MDAWKLIKYTQIRILNRGSLKAKAFLTFKELPGEIKLSKDTLKPA